MALLRLRLKQTLDIALGITPFLIESTAANSKMIGNSSPWLYLTRVLKNKYAREKVERETLKYCKQGRGGT